MIFEPAYQGHFFVYLSHLLPELIDLVGSGQIVLQTSDPALTSMEFEQLIRPFSDRIEVRGGISEQWQQSGAAGSAKRADVFVRCTRESRADHVILPTADGIGHALALHRGRSGGIPRGVTSEALYFQGKFLYPCAGMADMLRQRIKWEIGRRAPFTFIHHLDPAVFDWEKERASNADKFNQRWSLMPDPIEPPRQLTKQQARRALGVPEDGRLLGCAGMIDLRKGCDLMVRAFGRARLAPTDRMVIAGPHKPEMRQLLAGEFAQLLKSGRLISIDRLLRPEELADALTAMDLVCTPYPKHIGSASIVIRAAATSRPVLGSDYAWLRRTIPMFKLGWTCAVQNIDEFARAMERSLEAATEWRPTEAASRFVQFHDYRNFRLCATLRVRRLLGLPAIAAHRDWAWVMAAVGGEHDSTWSVGTPPSANNTPHRARS